MIAVIVVVTFLAILAFDLLPEWNSTDTKGKIIYITLLLVSLSVLILYILDVPVPSPTMPITKLIDALFPMIKQ